MLDPNRLRQAREAFCLAGLSVADWARQNQFSAPLVYAVLQGRNQATRGESHRIAVALGLKPALAGPFFPRLGEANTEPAAKPLSSSITSAQETAMS